MDFLTKRSWWCLRKKLTSLYLYWYFHAVQTPNEVFFHKNSKLLGLGRKIGQTKFLCAPILFWDFNFISESKSVSRNPIQVLELEIITYICEISPGNENFDSKNWIIIRNMKFELWNMIWADRNLEHKGHLGYFWPIYQHPFWYRKPVVHVFH